jgi:hypothetical protein
LAGRRGAAAGLRLLVALTGAVLLAGCGGVTAPDLFIVYRSGSVPGARLTLLVNDGGVVHCNGGPARPISDSALVAARAIQEDLHDPAVAHSSLPAGNGSVLSYYVRDPDGTVRFSDDSSRQPAVFRQLALFVLQTGRGVCRLPL